MTGPKVERQMVCTVRATHTTLYSLIQGSNRTLGVDRGFPIAGIGPPRDGFGGGAAPGYCQYGPYPGSRLPLADTRYRLSAMLRVLVSGNQGQRGE
jgi:hypothetical protein